MQLYPRSFLKGGCSRLLLPVCAANVIEAKELRNYTADENQADLQHSNARDHSCSAMEH